MADTTVSSTPTPRKRPLSPHLQVYRLPLPAIASITHRATGAALTGGTVLFAWWLLAAASGPAAWATFQDLAGSILGLLVLAGFTWALWYHTLNGIRHLVWDAGYALDLPSTYRGGYIVWGASVGLTLATLAAAFLI